MIISNSQIIQIYEKYKFVPNKPFGSPLEIFLTNHIF